MPTAPSLFAGEEPPYQTEADETQAAYDQGYEDGKAAERRLAEIEIKGLKDQIAGLEVYKTEFYEGLRRERERLAKLPDDLPF